jgi:hypothetical protein
MIVLTINETRPRREVPNPFSIRHESDTRQKPEIIRIFREKQSYYASIFSEEAVLKLFCRNGSGRLRGFLDCLELMNHFLLWNIFSTLKPFIEIFLCLKFPRKHYHWSGGWNVLSSDQLMWSRRPRPCLSFYKLSREIQSATIKQELRIKINRWWTVFSLSNILKTFQFTFSIFHQWPRIFLITSLIFWIHQQYIVQYHYFSLWFRCFVPS